MLLKYGNDICLLDATYGTSVYELPLLIVCVATNVGYVNVASILVSDEKSDTIIAGLKILSNWNPGWKPKYWMSDFHEGQILALETIFTGKTCSVFCLMCCSAKYQLT
jgi:MULE transposase domain